MAKLMTPNLKHLYYFDVFAQELSVKDTAKRLNITSAALSNQLKELSSHVGAKLFIYDDRRFTLTPEGDELRNYTSRMFAIYLDLQKNVPQNQEIRKSQLRFGICNMIGLKMSLEILKGVKRNKRSSFEHVSYLYASNLELLDGFKSGKYDTILGAFSPNLVIENQWNATQFPLAVHLVFPKKVGLDFKDLAQLHSPAAINKAIQTANDHQLPLVKTQHPSLLRDETDAYLLKTEISPLRTIECNSLAAILEILETNQGYAFLPKLYVNSKSSRTNLIILGSKEGIWQHRLSLLQKQKAC